MSESTGGNVLRGPRGGAPWTRKRGPSHGELSEVELQPTPRSHLSIFLRPRKRWFIFMRAGLALEDDVLDWVSTAA